MPASPALPGEVDGAAVGRLTPELRTLADRFVSELRRLLVSDMLEHPARGGELLFA